MNQIRQTDGLWRDMLFTWLASLLTGVSVALVLLVLSVLFSSISSAQGLSDEIQQLGSLDQPEIGSTLRLSPVSGGSIFDAPKLETRVEMNVSGMLARVSVIQRFKNPATTWVEGIYVFPLPESAAVDRMRLRIDERLIEGEIQERSKAIKSYQQAKREGRKGSLLSQERPNVFTTSVANIGPGEEVQVELEYQQSLTYDQGRFSIRFPLVVAPRYIPGAPLAAEKVVGFKGNGWARATDRVEDASRITPPVVAHGGEDFNPVSIKIHLNPGVALRELESRYHPVNIEQSETGEYRVSLQSGVVPANRDFELVWMPDSGQAPAAALFKQRWNNARYALLMIVPPSAGGLDLPSIRREVVLVIDTSGSMHGESIEQAREALKLALKRLKPEDSFNILSFNHSTDMLFSNSVAASTINIRRALRYVDGLEAEGGTEMLGALRQVLDGSESSNRLRQVVFLTDGSVGNEAELFSHIRKKLGDSRLFTIGIGSAPNSFFMSKAAQFGRGSFTYIGRTDEVKQRMVDLFRKLESPALTDIGIQWPDAAGVTMYPERIPDLYAGEPVVVAIRSEKALENAVLHGKLGVQDWTSRIELDGGSESQGVHVLWARRAIAGMMDQVGSDKTPAQVRQSVVALALEHKLVSRYTSLVALDKTPVRPQMENLQTKSVPVAMPHGWSAAKVFGQLPQTATSAPLNLLLGLIALVAGLFAGLYRKTGTVPSRRLVRR